MEHIYDEDFSVEAETPGSFNDETILEVGGSKFEVTKTSIKFLDKPRPAIPAFTPELEDESRFLDEGKIVLATLGTITYSQAHRILRNVYDKYKNLSFTKFRFGSLRRVNSVGQTFVFSLILPCHRPLDKVDLDYHDKIKNEAVWEIEGFDYAVCYAEKLYTILYDLKVNLVDMTLRNINIELVREACKILQKVTKKSFDCELTMDLREFSCSDSKPLPNWMSNPCIMDSSNMIVPTRRFCGIIYMEGIENIEVLLADPNGNEPNEIWVTRAQEFKSYIYFSNYNKSFFPSVMHKAYFNVRHFFDSDPDICSKPNPTAHKGEEFFEVRYRFGMNPKLAIFWPAKIKRCIYPDIIE